MLREMRRRRSLDSMSFLFAGCKTANEVFRSAVGKASKLVRWTHPSVQRLREQCAGGVLLFLKQDQCPSWKANRGGLFVIGQDLGICDRIESSVTCGSFRSQHHSNSPGVDLQLFVALLYPTGLAVWCRDGLCRPVGLISISSLVCVAPAIWDVPGTWTWVFSRWWTAVSPAQSRSEDPACLPSFFTRWPYLKQHDHCRLNWELLSPDDP